ncbi:MAG: uL22 family ribosomal protein, partial [Synergistales bacterium]|nr:uL22 family ribosomal protein [Synergistales bacterium]
MEAKAIARQVRLSPTKSRQVLTLIRGKKAGQALDTLRFTPKKAARVVEKVLKSAIAN